MAVTPLKLSNPLPRIIPPSKLANGDTIKYWTLDPYLESLATALANPWEAATAIAAKRGLVVPTGIAGIYRFYQAISPQQTGVIYISVDNVNGLWDFFSGTTTYDITGPGEWLGRNAAGDIMNKCHLRSRDSYFINDPSFKSLPFGQLPVLASVGNEAWCTGDTPTDAVKLDNGTIAIAMTGGNGNLIWKSAWAQSNDVLVEIDVQSVPQGGSLRIITLGGTTALTITAAGRYSVVVNMNAGQDISVISTATVSGSAIINSLKARRLTQTWTCEGNPTIRVKEFFGASGNYFDRILNPQTIHMATEFEQPNMQGWNPPPGRPILGYGQMPPPSGYFRVGDTIRNNCAIAGSVSGWRCIASGNPGTWMPLATL